MEDIDDFISKKVNPDGTIKKMMRRPSMRVLGGKLPPQAMNEEEVVLGAVLLEQNAIIIVQEIIKPTDFYKTEHQEIYAAVLNLYKNSSPIDIITVTNQLRSEARLDLAGGAFYISELTNKVSSSANIEFHARIIKQKSLLRRIIEISSKSQSDAYDETADVFDLLEFLQREFILLLEDTARFDTQTSSSFVKDMMERVELTIKNTNHLIGLSTGFSGLDNLISGYCSPDVIVVAARPGMGKTAFVLSSVVDIVLEQKKPVSMFSFEMDNVQLSMRLASQISGVDHSRIRRGEMDENEWNLYLSACGKLSSAPLYLTDTAGMSIYDIKAKMIQHKMKHGIELFVIDYLQLIKKSERRMDVREGIMEMTREIKQTAKSLGVPILELCQLNRDVEKRGDKRPQLSDLQESGTIEQDADIVIFLYRPEYYGINEDADGGSTHGVTELIVAKNRHGAIDPVFIHFDQRTMKFKTRKNDDQPF